MNFKKLLAQSLLWRSLYFASMLLVNVFLSRFLKAAGTGNLYYLSNIFSFVQLVVGLSLEAGITYYVSGKTIAANKLFWFSVLWSFLVAAFVLAGFFYYQYYLQHAPLVTAMEYCFFAVCYITGVLLTGYCSSLFYAQGNYIISNVLLVILNIAFVCTLVFKTHGQYGYGMHATLRAYFLVFFLQGIAVVLAFAVTNKSWKEFSFPSLPQCRQLLAYSVTALSGNIIFFLVYRVDYLFVHANTAACSDTDLGNYIQVSKMGQLLLIVPQIIASVIFPGTASGSGREELNTSLMIISRLLSQLFLGITIFTLLFGRWLFVFVFGPTFNRMQVPFLIELPGILCLSVLALLSAYFGGKGNLRVTVVGAAFALAAVVVGDYFAVPVYGIIGAAFISTVGYFINMLYSLLQFYKDYSLSWGDFFKWRKQDYHWLLSIIAGK
jgi:O-antigen/teichoic acid export membrane protein